MEKYRFTDISAHTICKALMRQRAYYKNLLQEASRYHDPMQQKWLEGFLKDTETAMIAMGMSF